MKPRTPEEALAFFQALPPSDIRPGLERMQFALAALDHPQNRYPAVHVAGTNGKGSTCAFLAATLRAQGKKVGLYTSPHLERVNERFKVNGEDITDAVLGQRVLEIMGRLPETLAVTYFEVGTLVALWHFAQEKVDVAVIETGLGGRLDATVLCAPFVTALTAIDFDHTDWLGTTLDEIATEKAGIFKPKVPAISARQAPEALAAIERVAREVGAPLAVEGRDFRLEETPGRPGLTFTGRRGQIDGLELGLKGAHQVQNAAVALACLELAVGKHTPPTPEVLREGLRATRWPGRLEEVAQGPTVLLDGAHNPQGAAALRAELDGPYAKRPVHLVFGVLADKSWLLMARTLFPRCASVHLCPVPGTRGLDPARIAEAAGGFGPALQVHTDAALALSAARRAAGPEAMVVGAGSLYLVGILRALCTPRSP